MERGGGGTQGLHSLHGQGPSAPWPGGRGWAVAACWHRWACTAPSPPRPPALPLSWHGRHRAAPGAAPGGTWPRKVLTAVTLSSPACVLCGRVDEDSIIHGHKHEDNGFYFHTFCVVSSLLPPSTKEWFPPFCPNKVFLLVQIFANGLRLGGRFHNNQFRHSCTYLGLPRPAGRAGRFLSCWDGARPSGVVCRFRAEYTAGPAGP